MKPREIVGETISQSSLDGWLKIAALWYGCARVSGVVVAVAWLLPPWGIPSVCCLG